MEIVKWGKEGRVFGQSGRGHGLDGYAVLSAERMCEAESGGEKDMCEGATGVDRLVREREEGGGTPPPPPPPPRTFDTFPNKPGDRAQMLEHICEYGLRRGSEV